jgi:hypothetical protein
MPSVFNWNAERTLFTLNMYRWKSILNLCKNITVYNNFDSGWKSNAERTLFTLNMYRWKSASSSSFSNRCRFKSLENATFRWGLIALTLWSILEVKKLVLNYLAKTENHFDVSVCSFFFLFFTCWTVYSSIADSQFFSVFFNNS